LIAEEISLPLQRDKPEGNDSIYVVNCKTDKTTSYNRFYFWGILINGDRIKRSDDSSVLGMIYY
jgi:hypothetical protein